MAAMAVARPPVACRELAEEEDVVGDDEAAGAEVVGRPS
jgi:hypothetical protein